MTIFKISRNCRIEICQSLKWKATLNIPGIYIHLFIIFCWQITGTKKKSSFKLITVSKLNFVIHEKKIFRHLQTWTRPKPGIAENLGLHLSDHCKKKTEPKVFLNSKPSLILLHALYILPLTFALKPKRR